MNNDQHAFESTMNGSRSAAQGVSTSTGVIIKSFIGIMIAFGVAIPNLFSGNYFGEFFISIPGVMGFIAYLFFVFIVGAIWFALTSALLRDKGALLNAITYGATCAFAGLLLANALIVAVSWIGYFAPDIDVTMVMTALKFTAVLTFIAVLAGIFILPTIKMTEKTISFAQNIAKIVLALAMASFVVIILAYFLALFGMYGLLNAWMSLLYGVGAGSIILSVFGVLIAEFLFLAILATVKAGIGNTPKYQEYYLSILMVNGILRIYIAIFKLVLKLMAARNRN